MGGSHLFFYKQHMVLIYISQGGCGDSWHEGDFVSKTLLGPGGGGGRGEAAEKTEREMILSHPQQSLNHRAARAYPRLQHRPPWRQEGPSEAQPG